MSDIYKHKPESINTIPNLIAFVQGIPEDRWTVDNLQDHDGRRCVAGHINAAYGGDAFLSCDFFNGSILPRGVNPHDLVEENNGCGYARDTSGRAAKARVLAYLEEVSHSPLPTTSEPLAA